MPTRVLRKTLLWVTGLAGAAVALYSFRHYPVSPPIPDGDYAVRNLSTKLALDDPYSSRRSGEQIIEWDWNEGLNQKWSFSHRGEGCYSIRNRKSGLFLTDPGAPTQGEIPLEQQVAKNDDSQLWCLSGSGNAFTIRNKARNLLIREPTTGSKLGSGVVLSPRTGEPDSKRKWAISRSG